MVKGTSGALTATEAQAFNDVVGALSTSDGGTPCFGLGFQTECSVIDLTLCYRLP